MLVRHEVYAAAHPKFLEMQGFSYKFNQPLFQVYRDQVRPKKKTMNVKKPYVPAGFSIRSMLTYADVC
jgi:hypothetical protein